MTQPVLVVESQLLIPPHDDSDWVVAPYDVPRCRDWEWERDRVYVYDDYSHPGWYVLFNPRLGRSIHVKFFGL